MSKILEFPLERIKSKKVRNELEKLREDLKETYEKMERAYELLTKMEEHIEAIELSYNRKLAEYATDVGIENLSMEDFEYASNIVVTSTPTGTITFSMEGVDNEVVFEPEIDTEE